MLNELTLFELVKKGDIKSFEIIFRKYYISLYYYALSIVKDDNMADEIIQQLFYTIWKNRESIKITHSLESYLYKSTLNQSLLQIRNYSIRNQHLTQWKSSSETSTVITPHSEMENKELELLINDTISKLPERRRRIYQMHKEDLLKYKEIAEKLSLSVKTVEAEMTKAYKELRLEIDKYIRNHDSIK